jgi:hypothetical protein
MRSHILFFLCTVLVGGCASSFLRDESRIVATHLGIAEEKVTVLAHQTSVRHSRSIAWIRMSVAIDGAFEVGLSDQPGSPHGIVVIFRKVDGYWQEDPASQMPWIV